MSEQQQNRFAQYSPMIPLADLATITNTSPTWIVNGLIATGLTVLASPPKTGKSWFALDMVTAVSRGDRFFGHDTTQCPTLYMCLEDGTKRIKSRCQILGIDVAHDYPDCVLQPDAPPIDAGLVDFIDLRVQERHFRLIVIDTLARIRGTKFSRLDAYRQDSQDLGQLQKYAISHDIAIVLITHLRKGGTKITDDDDPFELITGSTGQMGVADTAAVILGKRRDGDTDTEFRFKLTGRDVPDQSLVCKLDLGGDFRWHVIGNTADVLRQREEERDINDPVTQMIVDRVQESPDGQWKTTSKEILGNLMQRPYDTMPTAENKLSTRIAQLQPVLEKKYHIRVLHSQRYDSKAHGKPYIFRDNRYGRQLTMEDQEDE